MEKKPLSKIQKKIIAYVSLIVGAFIFAVSTYMFLVPARLIPGGVTGLGSMIQNLFGFSSQYTIIILNVPILIFALVMLDKKFSFRTIIGLIIVAGFMELFERINMYTFSSADAPIIASLVSGILSGFGIGLMFNGGASSGGTDVIGMLIQKRLPDIKLAYILLAMNILIMTISAIMYIAVGKMEANYLLVLLVCSIIESTLSSKGMDFMLNGINSGVKFEIVTKKDKEICDKILHETNYGVTVVESMGAYLEQKNKILICIVPRLYIPKIKKIIHYTDPDAFVFTTKTSEIMGKKFRAIR